ncbi:transposase [Nocardioides marinisabuli]|uniref:transposase n=1 Tax=Nocardioides marinisabuli TaxID=419476 RepID=UPI003D2F9ACF
MGGADYGIGPAGAARILVDVGGVARFAGRNRFASWTGTAPLDAFPDPHGSRYTQTASTWRTCSQAPVDTVGRRTRASQGAGVDALSCEAERVGRRAHWIVTATTPSTRKIRTSAPISGRGFVTARSGTWSYSQRIVTGPSRCAGLPLSPSKPGGAAGSSTLVWQ